MLRQQLIPPALRPGDTIAFVSPSSRLNDVFPSVLKRASSALEAHSFAVKVFWTPRPPDTELSLAESISVRMAELRAAFSDPRRGSGAEELIPAIIADETLHATIRAQPKVFVGMSNSSHLHWALGAATGLRTYYGPTGIPELGEAPECMQFTMDELLRVVAPSESAGKPLGRVPRSEMYAIDQGDYLIGGDPESTKPRTLMPSPKWKWIRGGKAKGSLFGASLYSWQSLLGSAAAPSPDDTEFWSERILFLETSFDGSNVLKGTPLAAVRDMLAHLVASGVLNRCAGLIIGRPYRYDTDETREQFEGAVREVLCREGHIIKYPILIHVDVGHTSPMVTLPYGVLTRLDSEADEVSFLEAGVA
ncbi:peptidase u61 ld-carboxypeptidase a [Mycena galopus ATCC 62051]|nr:peptidase u61 ld-carboxypeptidase a [Mycena galopus ATCC 62051]